MKHETNRKTERTEAENRHRGAFFHIRSVPCSSNACKFHNLTELNKVKNVIFNRKAKKKKKDLIKKVLMQI